jgi:Nif-specific regulatory protein
VLRSVAELIDRPVTKDQLLKAMVDRVREELDAERGTLFLIDSQTGELVSRVAHLPELQEIRLPAGQGLAGHVALSGESLRLPEASQDERFFRGIDQQTGFVTRSVLTVPVRDRGGTIRGVLQLLNRRGGPFEPGHEIRAAELAAQVAEALELTSLRPAADQAPGLLLDGPFNHIIGASPPMQALYERMLAAATTDATVLLRGESGTGKSLVARAVHENSARRAGPLVHVDCVALPAGLIESELFGHERGAFTGADQRMPGKFERAEKGTLFLDEIGDLPLGLQGKLLRFLQDRSFERLGGRGALEADVRVISATHADLEAAVAAGAYRRDLYYRLRVVELTVPPLRERGPGDVALLAEHFLQRYARRHRRPVRALGPAALQRLQAHTWPGNVRELEHCLESAVVLCREEILEIRHLSLPTSADDEPTQEEPAPRGASAAGYPAGTPLCEVELDHLRRTLAACGGNRSEAAKRLGIGRNTLARKLRGEPE